MIKQLVQLVMPKQLGFGFGAAFAIGSFAFNVLEGKKRRSDVIEAQDIQTETERAVRAEQAGRGRRKQIRQSNILQAQAEAIQFSQAGQVAGGTSGGVSSAIQANLGRNLSSINFAQASGSALSRARSDVLNAGRPSTLGLVNQQLQPLLFSNIDKLDTFFESAFSSTSGTP